MYSSVGAIRNRPVRTNWQVRSGTQPRGLCHCLDPWLPSRLCMMQAVSTWNRLVSIPELALNPGLSIELLLIREEEVRRKDGLRHWRRKGWGVFDRRLIDVARRMTLETPSDFAAMLPADIPQSFSTQDLSDSLARPRREVQQMAYCLRKMGVIHITGKQGNALLYSRQVAVRIS